MKIGSAMAPQLARLSFPRENNLDWMRLIFALQVAVEHICLHLGFRAWRILSFFPGVPAFFFVSGFLIYASYRHAPGLAYFRNRVLRLQPALVLVTVGGLLVVLAARGPADLLAHPRQYGLWFLAQTTLGQAYNPGLFRNVGVGVINGSLWSITTEVLFYLMVPMIVWMERHFRHTVLVLVLGSFALYALGPVLFRTPLYGDKTFFDILALTPLVWGWMFGAGILAVKHFGRLKPWFPVLPLATFPLVALIGINTHGPVFGASGNYLGAVYFLALVAMLMYVGFATRVIKLRFDLSYGVYIWHMPVVNFLLVKRFPRSLTLALALTVCMATVSWMIVERPALRLKRRTLRPVVT
jgi:peptidoglycan/LPS O-acetylase OafA/YrhL